MFENTRRLETGRATGRLGAKVQSWFLFSLFLFLVNVFQSKQELTHMRKEQTSTQYLRGGILLVASDGPTTLGDFTTFTARIQHTQWPSTSHALWWIIPSPKEKFYSCKNASNGTSTLQYRKWHISGEKQVKVCVTSRRCNRFYKQKKPYEGFKCLLKNTTTVLVTDSINLDLEVWQNTTDPKQAAKSFFVGNVQMQAIIHGHLFNGQNVNYTWNFGDNKTITSHLPSHNHTYREDKMYLLSVTARSYVKGRLYYGSAAARLTFKVNLDAQLVAYGRRGTKLTPTKPLRDTYSLAPDEIKFVVEYKNAFSLVNSVSTDWKIDGYQIQNLSSNEFTYNVSQIGLHTVWVTYRFHTAHHEYSGSQNISLDIKEPIVDLKVSHTPNYKRKSPTIFHITCQGSVPISFCWLIAKNCKLPENSSCIPTIESNRCHTTVNHTFSNPGSYCLNVSVFNTVSSKATSFGIKIPEGHHAEPSKSSGSITAAVLIPLFLCIFIVAGFVYLVKHYVERSRKTVEKADFDFRDEDCRSISSVNLGTTFSSCYHVFDICGRKKNKQNVLILNCRGSQYGSVNNDL